MHQKWFERVRLKTNVDKSKVLQVRRHQGVKIEKLKDNWEGMEEVDNFKQLGIMISADGSMGEEVIHRLQERKMWKENAVF